MNYRWAPGVLAFPTEVGAIQIRRPAVGEVLEVFFGSPEWGEGRERLCRELESSVDPGELSQRLGMADCTRLAGFLDVLLDRRLVVATGESVAESALIVVAGDGEFGGIVTRALELGGRGVARLFAAERDGLPGAESGPGMAKSRQALLDSVERALAVAASGSSESFLVLVLAESDPGLLRATGRLCGEIGQTWIPVQLTPQQCVLGPLVIPGETACCDCVLIRGLAHAPDYAAELEYLRYAASRPFTPDGRRCSYAVAHLAAHLLVSEMAGYLSSGVSAILNGVRTIVELPFAIDLHSCQKLPGCPTCVNSRTRSAG